MDTMKVHIDLEGPKSLKQGSVKTALSSTWILTWIRRRSAEEQF